MSDVEVPACSRAWSGWIEALQSCNERLGKYLNEGDWEKAQAEVTTRDHLLHQSSGVLMRLKRAEQDGLDSGELQKVKQVLLEVTRTGQEFVETLEARRQELSHRIQLVQKGRAAVNLYRTPRPEAKPKFLDRKG